MANKTFDILSSINEDEVFSATGASAAHYEEGLNIGSASYLMAIKVTGATGVFDGSNNFTVGLSVCDTTGGTYIEVGFITINGDGAYEVGFTSEQIEATVAGAEFFKANVTLVGSTATDITISSFLSKN